MKRNTMRGALVAGMAAGMVLAGTIAAHAQDAASGDDILCGGVNECRGQGACKGKNHCEGKNDCRGKGIIRLSAEDCSAQGGKVVDENQQEGD
jgi:hypothetical protein